MDNSSLIKDMFLGDFLTREDIAQAFKEIDRKDFVGISNLSTAYQDRPLSIGKGQTISQPSTVAFMLEKLDPKPGNTILDIGSGSGWTTALLGYLVGDKGKVIGLERIPELVSIGKNNLSKYHLKNAVIKRAGEEVGLSKEGPYDKILVSAESDYLPIELIDQLKAGGRIVIPIQGAIEVVSKEADGSINQESYPGFIFVPLV